jgi:hypothetical protein
MFWVIATTAVLAWLTMGVYNHTPGFGHVAADAPYSAGDPLGPIQTLDAVVDSAWVFAALAAWTLVMWWRARSRGELPTIDNQLRANHLIQGGFQFAILAYWAVHWTDLRMLGVGMLLQIAYCFWLDFILSWALFGNWRITVGPVPLVLSTNLFLLYIGSQFRFGFLVFAIAMLSKHFIQRDGRHLFNPSAFGIVCLSLLWIGDRLSPPSWGLVGTFGYLPTFDPFALAPNMTEWLFLLALLSQLRFPYVLITLGAFIGFAMPGIPDATPPGFADPPIFIAVTFLITDPRTSPRTAFGRLLFGVAYALTARSLDLGLTALVGSDGDAKILAVPVINLMVPMLDRIGATLDTHAGLLLDPKHNRWHVLAWAIIGGLAFSDPGNKRALFLDRSVEATHFFSPWATEEHGALTCGHQDIWCTPFSFKDELLMVISTPPRPYERRLSHTSISPETPSTPPHSVPER